jgi:hypothetical protein
MGRFLMGLDTVEFLMETEKELNIKISDAEAGEIYTVGQFSRLCHSKQQEKSNNKMDEEQVFAVLKQILQTNFGIKMQINRAHLIVKDLGLD